MTNAGPINVEFVKCVAVLLAYKTIEQIDVLKSY